MCLDPFNHLLDATNCLEILVGIKSTVHFWIVWHLGISNTLIAVSTTLYFNCEIKLLVLQLPTEPAFWIFTTIRIFSGFTVLSTYPILLFSSVERYIAVCLPHSYQTNAWIKNPNLVIWVTRVLCLILTVVTEVGANIPLCRGSLAINYDPKHIPTPKIVFLTIIVSASIVITVLFFKVWRKLASISYGRTWYTNWRAYRLRFTLCLRG